MPVGQIGAGLQKPKRDPTKVPVLPFNEFIVYDPSQVRMRYLIQIDMNPDRKK